VQLQWTDAAEQDLEQIHDYYKQVAGSRIAADNILNILHAAEALRDMPNRSRPGRVPGTRELVLLNLPFLLPYRVQNNCIQVLRVFHMARQHPAEW
jgi:toxin ParE1/3/4